MNRTKVKSSNLASIGYDKEKKILEVEFLKSGIYQYLDVEEEEYTNLMSAESHGKYFASNVKARHEWTKIGSDFKDFKGVTIKQMIMNNFELGEIIYADTIREELKKWIQVIEADKQIIKIDNSRDALLAFLRYFAK